jgi:hypothetical protein
MRATLVEREPALPPPQAAVLGTVRFLQKRGRGRMVGRTHHVGCRLPGSSVSPVLEKSWMGLRSKLWRGAKSALGLRHLYELPAAPYVHGAMTDILNRARYGAGAPRFAERLWIDPRTVRRFDRKGTVWRSARVVRGAWPRGDEQPMEQDPILQTSIAHWVEGKSWEESGEVARMEATISKYPGIAGCFSRDDILQRCVRLDGIFRVIEREHRVRSMTELDPGNYREFGGIGMHVGPNGELIRAGHGRHRFAMALILGIELIPVRVGMVHRSALPVLAELRQQPTGPAVPPYRRHDRNSDAVALAPGVRIT